MMFSSLNSSAVISGRRTLSRLPSQLTDDWLKTLPLVKQPLDSVHYTGRQLQTALKQLRLVMDRDDPIEEYKVRSRHNDNNYFISSFGFSLQGSPQRIFHLHLVLYSASSSVTSDTAMSSLTALYTFPVSSFLTVPSPGPFSQCTVIFPPYMSKFLYLFTRIQSKTLSSIVYERVQAME